MYDKPIDLPEPEFCWKCGRPTPTIKERMACDERHVFLFEMEDM